MLENGDESHLSGAPKHDLDDPVSGEKQVCKREYTDKRQTKRPYIRIGDAPQA
jgi:hypothetical protein